MSKYHVPKLSKFDFGLIRSPGPGLGNLLFPLARALITARITGGIFVAPTIQQLKFGTFIRREADKRTYFGIFKRRTIPELIVFLKVKLMLIKTNAKSESSIIFHEGMGRYFHELKDHHLYIKSWLSDKCSSMPLKENNFVAMHIRRGDFNEGAVPGENTITSIDWYKDVLQNLRDILPVKCDKIILFTDGNIDELRDALSDFDVKIAPQADAMRSLLLMSEAKAIITSCSTFSLWANFLGQNYAIWHKSFDLEKYKEISSKDIFY